MACCVNTSVQVAVSKKQANNMRFIVFFFNVIQIYDKNGYSEGLNPENLLII